MLVFRKGLARFRNDSGCLPSSEFPVHSSPHVSLLRIKAPIGSDTHVTQSLLWAAAKLGRLARREGHSRAAQTRSKAVWKKKRGISKSFQGCLQNSLLLLRTNVNSADLLGGRNCCGLTLQVTASYEASHLQMSPRWRKEMVRWLIALLVFVPLFPPRFLFAYFYTDERFRREKRTLIKLIMWCCLLKTGF